MAEFGFSFAMDEITLVLFTTLTPSGVIAAMLVLARLLRPLPDGVSPVRIEHMLGIPLVVSMVGLVASASHLGSPTNALYVLCGVGRSPLSNEVASGVVFLGLLGAYWYYSFVKERREALLLPWRIVLLAAGVVFVLFIAFAYSAETIVTWNSPLVPLTLVANALLGGPLLAIVTLGVARAADGMRAPIVLAAIALLGNIVLYALQGIGLAQTGNFMVLAADLVPAFWLLLICFAVAAALGILLVGFGCMRPKGFSRGLSSTGCILALAAIFLMRFQFYAMHATAGLGV